MVWLHAQLPYRTARQKADVLLCPEVAVPYYHTTPSVAVVHDMLTRLYPAAMGWGGRLFHRLVAEESLRFADEIICVSEATRNELLRLVPLNPARVHVIYEGASPLFRPLPLDEALHAFLHDKYDLPFKKYILLLGMRNKRKNHVTLVEAFARLRQQAAFSDYQLALVGPPGLSQRADSTPLINNLIKQHGLEGCVKIIETPPDEDVVKIYNGAALFVYPSEAEGFGLPVLEAMQCGVPMVVSGVSAMPEVAGDAALFYHNPLSSLELCSRMAEALANPELLQQLRAKGLEQAKKFSWEKTGQQTLAVLKQAATKRNH
jgi:glycosyltransferase involved in cell wall biosynthesis